MTRLNLILLAALIGCAISVVTSQHQARKAFMELQVEQEHEQSLENEWRQLQLESRTLAQDRRIEQKAARELGMMQPDAKRTVVVVLPAADPAAEAVKP